MTSDNLDLLMKILSAGVIAAFVTGVFSLIVSAKTNKRLEKIELIKQRYAMEGQKYDQINAYYSELLKKGKQFEYKGKIEQTMKCVRQLFALHINMFEFLKEEHEKHFFLFDDSENEKIKEKENVIDNYIHEFVEKFKEDENADADENKYVEYIDRIAISIDDFKEDYYLLLSNKMKKILNK